MSAQFVIGIDLGTTNSVLAYSAVDAESAEVQLLKIPQLVDLQTVESRDSLPSFLYVSTEAEATAGAFDFNESTGRTFAVGEVARSRSAEFPDRTVGAAKSWLCHSKVDRHQAILPWKAPDSVEQVSPVTTSQRYLEHLVDAWQSAFPDAPIADQVVVLTVPASFDASARELTREAALAARLPDSLVLLEEPQAATYAWLTDVGDDWRKILSVNDRLLVCDVGGGTTDLTLVDVSEESGELQLQRKAVGNHLLVGGDNMDLALAHYVAELFKEQNVNLDPWQSVSLWHSCRNAKEALLNENGPATHTISVLGRGSKLIGGTVSVEVDRQTVADLLTDGFFATAKLSAVPARQRMSGFQEIGLPYESDAAITRHLAAFLTEHEANKKKTRPTHVLFNGGVFKSEGFRTKLLAQFASWFSDAPEVLVGNDDLDFSVARGATYYGWLKHHGGMRIRGGTARSYYVGIETAGLAIPGASRPLKALCVVPNGMEEGTDVDVDSDEIGLVVGESARFRFFSSPTRKEDLPGKVLDRWEDNELVETDSLEATLTSNAELEDEYVPVRFQSQLTELGVFELWCVHTRSDARWKLEFSVRDDADS
jgi:hypothetical protein